MQFWQSQKIFDTLLVAFKDSWVVALDFTSKILEFYVCFFCFVLSKSNRWI